MKEIIVLLPTEQESFLHWYTTRLSLERIANDNNIKYTYLYWNPSKINESFAQIDRNTNTTLIFFLHHPEVNQNHYDDLKYRRYNSTVIMMGGDSHYWGYDSIRMTPDVFLETMTQNVDALKHRNARLFKWTISQSLIDMIRRQRSQYADAVRRNRDLLCLCNMHPGLTHRIQQFRAIMDVGVDFRFNLKEFNINAVITLYRESFVILGTTTSCIEAFPTTRSIKGFRDWIAPFCGSVLIYDDHPEVHAMCDCIPQYNYLDGQSVKDLVNLFKSDYNERQYFLNEQIKWAEQNTIDKQFIDIMKEKEFI